MKNIKFKICFAILLFCLFCSISFAAIVADFDGQAFVTKNDFEMLKNELNSQIINYNTSLDNKIDGAIASYIAGLVKSSVTVDCNIEAFDYPLTIINKYKVIEEVTTKDTNTPANEPLWNLKYSFIGIGSRGSYFVKHQQVLNNIPGIESAINTQMEKLENTHVDKIEKYLNGVRSGANDFKVNNICQKPEISIQTGFIVENLQGWRVVTTPSDAIQTNTDKGVYSDITMDQRQIVSVSYSGDAVSLRSNLLDDYEALWQTKDFSYGAKSPYINLIHYANSPGHIANTGTQYSTKERYSYLTNPGNGIWEGLSGIGAFDAGPMWSYSYTYSNSNLDRIYNYGDSTLNTHFAPVTYDNNLFFTNKKANRFYNPVGGRLNWEARNSKPENPFGIKGVITAGENLENEKENSSGTRPWYNKSLISQTRLIYDFKDENGAVYANHRMVNGIPIFKVPKNDVVGVRVSINVASQKTAYRSNPKYVIFSTKPITTQSYSANVESNTDYIQIKNSTPTINLRKMKLSEGNNVLVLGDFDKNTIIYMKILWNDVDEEYITLQKPKISYTPE